MTTTSTAAPFRSVAASVWVVAACMWGLISIVLGGLRLHREWTTYQFLRDLQDGAYGWASISYADTSLVVPLLGVVWLGVSVAWLGSAVVMPARRLVVAAVAVVAIAAVATAVLLRADHDLSGLRSLEPRLLTPESLAAAVLVVDGIAALVISRWALRGD